MNRGSPIGYLAAMEIAEKDRSLSPGHFMSNKCPICGHFRIKKVHKKCSRILQERYKK